MEEGHKECDLEGSSLTLFRNEHPDLPRCEVPP